MCGPSWWWQRRSIENPKLGPLASFALGGEHCALAYWRSAALWRL